MAICRGEVYFVSFDPAVGREQTGRRPAVVVSNDRINIKPLVVLVVPGTRGSNLSQNYPTNVRVPAGEANLPEETVFVGFQMRALDHSRFAQPPAGKLSDTFLAKLDEALRSTLALADE